MQWKVLNLLIRNASPAVLHPKRNGAKGSAFRKQLRQFSISTQNLIYSNVCFWLNDMGITTLSKHHTTLHTLFLINPSNNLRTNTLHTQKRILNPSNNIQKNTIRKMKRNLTPFATSKRHSPPIANCTITMAVMRPASTTPRNSWYYWKKMNSRVFRITTNGNLAYAQKMVTTS